MACKKNGEINKVRTQGGEGKERIERPLGRKLSMFFSNMRFDIQNRLTVCFLFYLLSQNVQSQKK